MTHLAGLLLLAQLATPSASAPMLVDTAWLKGHLADKNLVLLHVGPKPEFLKEHIPGAQLVVPQDLSVPRKEGELILQVLPQDELLAKLQSYGVSDDSRIVIYFAADWISLATRVYWSLDVAGLGAQTSLLDGGLGEWKRALGALAGDIATPVPGRLTFRPRQELVADLETVKKSPVTAGVALVDARLPKFFDGEEPGMGVRSGHIPGAVAMPFPSLSGSDLVMKSDAETRALFEATGIAPGDTVISYCHIGQQATVVYFAAKRLGYKALVYDGAWDEWSRKSDLKIVGPKTAAAPAPKQ